MCLLYNGSMAEMIAHKPLSSDGSVRTEFGEILRRLRKSAGLLQRQVAEKAGMDPSVLSRLETGQYRPPDRSTVLGLARAMNLSLHQTDDLLAAAGHPPETVLDIPGLDLRDSSLRALFHEVAAVRAHGDPVWAAALEEAMRVMLAGARLVQTEAIVGLASPPPSEAPRLTVEEEAIDDHLTAVLASRGGSGVTARPLDALETGELSWELRRRMAEALPRLVELDAEGAFRMAAILRMDYDEKRWHSDVRRRVVEAVPALYVHDETRALALLEPRPQDQVYVHIATVEVLRAIPQIPHEDAQRILLALKQHEEPEHVGLIEFLMGLLDLIGEGKTAEALVVMQESRDRDRMFRTCIVRALPRLFDTQAVGALWLMLHFYRRAEGRYAEHVNVRRPAAMALPRLISLLDSTEAGVLARVMIWQLAEDEEAIMRRAVADGLPDLMAHDPGFARQIVDHFVMDSDPYVRRRGWSAKTRLGGSQ
jgi:transcriptional regulator with XRE-family HTH domain